MPAVYQGARLSGGEPPIENLTAPAGIPPSRQRAKLDLLGEIDREYATAVAHQTELEARIRSYELAYRMQAAAPEAVDLAAETEETKCLYGLDEKPTAAFGRNCLLARRFVERGVRFVPLYHGSGSKWDAYSSIEKNHTELCRQMDKPVAGLLADLRRRGLLDSTLVVWGGGEFGRTPMSEKGNGRDHNPTGFTVWMAGGGVPDGTVIGATDEAGLKAVEERMHVHDLHATIPQILGLYHMRLVYTFKGRPERPTLNEGEANRRLVSGWCVIRHHALRGIFFGFGFMRKVSRASGPRRGQDEEAFPGDLSNPKGLGSIGEVFSSMPNSENDPMKSQTPPREAGACLLFMKTLLLVPFVFISELPGQETPYREEIVTPHWIDRCPHAEGTVDALFLVNDLARREPDELGQRFDINVRQVRTLRGSSAYKNVFDVDALAEQLAGKPDVFVVGAVNPWKDLGPKGLGMTTEWVRNGGKLLVFTKNAPESELKDMSLEWEEPRELTDEVSQGIDLEPIFPGKSRKSFAVTQAPLGKGTITFARPFDRHWVYFNAFFPNMGSWNDPDVARETAYLLANRIIRSVAGKPDQFEHRLNATPEPGGIAVDGELAPGMELGIQLRSASGQLLTEAAAGRLPVTLPAQTTGLVTVLWEIRDSTGKRAMVGTQTIDMGDPVPLEVAALPSPYPRNKPVRLEWTPILDHDDWEVEAEVYDPDRNRIRLAVAPAAAGSVTIPAWHVSHVSHEIRLVLTGPGTGKDVPAAGVTRQKTNVRKGRRILGERYQRLSIAADPVADKRQWTTLTWGDERGDMADRWRGHRLRSLGLNATAPIGRTVETSRWASSSGLRIVPTNVFVPENRFNKGRFDEKQTIDWLAEFATAVAPLSPLGYSFADEPPDAVILPWLDKGAAVLAEADPNARFGYCGVFPGTHSPELMRKSGYLGLYSPSHLYNLNIWLGIERDVYRSFRSPDGIVTIWTHYAPWADHEPYSRTVPWAWLFDGMDGVGFFKSAGMFFGILDGDLRATHETRWWSEEIRELNAGVAEQVKRMSRDVGTIRILFGGNLKAVEPWARAMNELSVPYQFLDAQSVREEDLRDVRLLIAVDGGAVGEAIEAFVKKGGVVLGGGGLASRQGDSGESFERVFGFAPKTMAGDANSGFAGIRSTVMMGTVELEGVTTGECLPAAPDGTPWKSLGGGGALPDRLKTIAASSAVRVSSGRRAMYLAHKPDTESVKRLLPTLMSQAAIPMPDIRLESEDRAYVTRFSDGVARLVGVVPDYIRIEPIERLQEIAPNPLDSDDNVQKRQQAYFQHGQKRWRPVKARLALGEKTHLYDVRRGEHLGEMTGRELSIQPGRPELFALLPYGPPAIKLAAPAEAAAGADFDFQVTLASDTKTLATHVVRAELAGVPNAAANLHAENGTATGRFSIPHGLEPGTYQLLVRDILTGAKAQATLAVGPPETIATAPLPSWDFRVERRPVEWPSGTWETIPADVSIAEARPATAKVSPLTRKAINYGPFNGKQHLESGFTIGNGLQTYKLKYLVCCDSREFDAGPPQRVKGLNGSGLGMDAPRAHLWYYNGYIKIHLGDREAEMALDYELAEIENISDETTARVRLTWKAPAATVRLEYAMVPGHEGLFQQLTIEPDAGKPLTKATVSFRCFPAGFDKGGAPFYEVAQEHREWLLMGDAVRDRDFYETGKGSAGLLIRPQEWADVKYGPPVLAAERPAADGGKPWRLHWVTWMFPERGNAAAKQYMQTNSESTERRLSEVFAR